jgi:glutamate dehydrogenase (NAD(P)+)
MNKRFEEASRNSLLGAVERITGHKLSDEERRLVTQGADELALVRSGLEDTMVTAYDMIRDTMHRTDGAEDLRTAAFVAAINRVALAYQELGIFP